MGYDFLEGQLPKYFFREMCSSGGKQTIHKVSAAFIVKNCHPRTFLKTALGLSVIHSMPGAQCIFFCLKM